MSKKIFAGIFVSFLSLFFLLNIFVEDVHFSEQENRALTQKPEFTWNNVISGKFMTQFEKYISDQFPWKNGWVFVKAKAEKSLGKKENNGVVFGSDGYLFERYDKLGENLEKNMDRIHSFVNQADSLKAYLLLAPTAVGIYPEKLPNFATSLNQIDLLEKIQQDLDGIKFIDVYNPLVLNKEEAVYFKTDHHWTMRGAYTAYIAAAREMGFEALSLADFEIETVSENFYGTLYSKAGAYDAKSDEIELFIPKKPLQIRVTYDDGEIRDSLFAMEYLDQKDKYALFLGGNHSLVKIETDAGTGRKLSVVKDSYAHAFIPFLANHFDEIHVIDLRYFKKDVRSYMETNHIRELLFLYNLPNFTVDTNIMWLK